MGLDISAIETMRFSAEDGILEMQSHIVSPSSEGLLGGSLLWRRQLDLSEIAHPLRLRRVTAFDNLTVAVETNPTFHPSQPDFE